MPGANDKPYWSLATGYAAPNLNDPVSTAGRGITNTLLRPFNTSAWDQRRMFEPSNPVNSNTKRFTDPYRRFELLNKLYNNLTTRSNVFAVWLTVGFFEVTDDTTRPVKLGAEIGKAEGRHVRHRMFAIVDRTNLQVWPTFDPTQPAGSAPLATVQTTAAVTVTGGVPVTANLSLSATTGINPYTGRRWQIQAGSVLTYEPDTDNEETVVVQDPQGKGGKPITGATNATPIVLTSANHGLATGQSVSIVGVGGNTAANGVWVVTVVDANTFSLGGSAGNGAYTAGGTWFEAGATFARSHAQGVPVISRGNPGPWLRYDPRKDAGVVPFLAVIN
jgi:hypothetical protein